MTSRQTVGMVRIPIDDSDAPPAYNNCVQELYGVQRDQEHAVTQRKSSKPKIKHIFWRSSPWLALTSLLLMVVMTFFMCHLWRDLQQVELKQYKLAIQIEMDHVARQKFLSELTDMMAEQEKTHLYSLGELEQKMKSSLELMAEQGKTHQRSLEDLEKKIEQACKLMAEQEQARKLMADQQKTHPYTTEEPEMKIQDALAVNGDEGRPEPKTQSPSFWWTSNGATMGLPCRLVPLLSSLAIFLLWQQ